MITEPPKVYSAFEDEVGDTACKIVGAIASDKPYVGAMIKNVAAIVDGHISTEFEKLWGFLVRDHPELFADLQTNPHLASPHALRRYAYKGSSKIK